MTHEIVDFLFEDLRSASRKLFQNSKHGQISNEGRMLYMVAHHPNEHMSFYAKRLQVSMPNMSILAQKMVEEGLLERQVDTHDRRRTTISITDKGKELGSVYRDQVRNEFALKFEVLTKEEQAEFLHSLKNVVHYLKKVGNR